KVKHAGLGRLKEALGSRIGENGSAHVPFGDIAEHYPFAQQDKVSKKEAVLLAQLLEKIGLGMEPDVRFGGIKPTPDDDLVIFRQSEDAPSAPSQAFEAAVLLMRLAAMVSAADGDVSPEEQEHLEQHLQTSLSLSDGERQRLHAHTEWLLAHEHQSFAGLKPKLEALAEPQRRSIGEFLITVAAADGQIDPGEVKILQKLYGRLGLDPDQVVSILHNFTSEPVTVKPGVPRSGFSVPAAPDQAQAGSSGAERQSLDPEALQKKLSETARVSELLHGVFGDEEAESVSEGSHRPQATDEQNVPGLDAEHSALLRAIGAKDSWERSELEQIAEEHGLLLDGALEAINELAFDHADSPCIEEDGDIYLLERAAYEEIST
ncbi:MAG: tellurite resistance TerB C-terminal domain-containing protein, partial [Wenzhouxiangella sp.]|nr:tellurite resistance TerB C-terminal domain-containing protein [Wenzhouxiangella sp.]